MLLATTISLFLELLFVGAALADDTADSSYGVDISFPIHRRFDPSFSSPEPLGDRRTLYENYMQGCKRLSGEENANSCDEQEQIRLDMNFRQPQSVVNYTSTGFQKIRAPEEAFGILKAYWERHKDNVERERWEAGNIYSNMWDVETTMVPLDREDDGGATLTSALYQSVQSTLEEWTGQHLSPCSLYGIRVYGTGAILSPHVDRFPLISSAIINVDQDVDEPWPLEVYLRDGTALNVTMEPGDMVLYESHSLVHGRPFPLKGKYFANLFVHFEATGIPLGSEELPSEDLGEGEIRLPPYVLKGSPEEAHWRKTNLEGWKITNVLAEEQEEEQYFPVQSPQFIHRPPPAHVAAVRGDIARLAEILDWAPEKVRHRDGYGWQPLHEAVSRGHLEVVHLLLESGHVDVNERTHGGWGASPLHIALEGHGPDSPISELLVEYGGINYEPELDEL